MSKTALIVDDSKSARVLLQRVLERHALDVDTAESAENALEYLIRHRPDVIFMDHQMPGMDGFEAVTAIKRNPDTATIPIMMYTSQKGEVYVGQARALGAVGVLPKELAPVEVSKVLQSLHLIESETDQSLSEAPPIRQAKIETLDQDLRTLIQELFEQQQAVMRRDFLDSYEALATRVAEEITQPVEYTGEISSTNENNISGLIGLAIIVLAISTTLFGILLWTAKQDQRELQSQVNELQQQLSIERASSKQALNEALESQCISSAEESFKALNQISEHQQKLDRLYTATVGSLAWGSNQAASYAFGELPLGNDRLSLVENLTDQLEAIEFTGTVQIEIHAGDFCQAVSDTSGYVLAENQPASACDRIGPATGETLENSLGQSVAFASFIQLAVERNNGRFLYDIVSRGNSEPLVAYPASLVGVTADDWNRIAAANNRVVISLLPDNN